MKPLELYNFYGVLFNNIRNSEETKCECLYHCGDDVDTYLNIVSFKTECEEHQEIRLSCTECYFKCCESDDVAIEKAFGFRPCIKPAKR
jgi:hypothetical protein